MFQIAKALYHLCNFEDLGHFLNILNHPIVKDFGRLNPTEQAQLDEITKASGKDWVMYNELIKQRFSTHDPAIPNMSIEIEMFPLNVSNMPDFDNELIHWTKHKQLAARTQILYRFQNIKYNFYEISQIQKILLNAKINSFDKNIKKLKSKRSQIEKIFTMLNHVF